MFRRSARDRSSGGARRCLGLAGALIACALVVSACEVETGSTPGISGTCTSPTTIHEGFAANRSVFYSIRSQSRPGDPRATWVCFRLKAADTVDQAGRVEIRTPGVVAGEPTSDSNSRACTTTPGNTAPGPHPIEQGAVGDVPFYLDVYNGGSPGSVWVCIEVGNVKARIMVPVPSAELPWVKVFTDSAPPTPVGPGAPPLGQPSAGCYEGKYGTPTELVNAEHGNRHLWLYSSRPSTTEAHLCARLSGPQQGGVHLGVNASPGQVVDIQQSPDTTPCTRNVITLSTPPLSISHTPLGTLPPSVCVNGTRYTIVTTPTIPPPIVTLQTDS